MGKLRARRGTLRRVLLKGLEDHAHFGKCLVSHAENSDGTVTARFEDGIQATGDVLIGADGAGSAVRKQRLPETRLEDTGIVSLGGKLPMTPASRALLTDKMFYGMSMITAPRGFGAIIHSLEFTQSRSNPTIAARWPEFADAFADDSIGWGLIGARQNFSRDPATLVGEELIGLALELTRDWNPRMGRLIRMTDLATIRYLSVRTSAPLSPWASSNVTLIGDAIHTMTPGRGAGANTALRDAMLLGQGLIEVNHRRKPLVQAIHDYEVEMRRYGSEAVAESKKQMDSTDTIHRPIVGGIQLALMRAGMRTVNAIPPLKHRMLRKMMKVRGAN